MQIVDVVVNVHISAAHQLQASSPGLNHELQATSDTYRTHCLPYVATL